MPVPRAVQRSAVFLGLMLMVGSWVAAWVNLSTHPDAVLHGAAVLVVFGAGVAVLLGRPLVS